MQIKLVNSDRYVIGPVITMSYAYIPNLGEKEYKIEK
jgi:hypothetical protein